MRHIGDGGHSLSNRVTVLFWVLPHSLPFRPQLFAQLCCKLIIKRNPGGRPYSAPLRSHFSGREVSIMTRSLGITPQGRWGREGGRGMEGNCSSFQKSGHCLLPPHTPSRAILFQARGLAGERARGDGVASRAILVPRWPSHTAERAAWKPRGWR